MSSTGKTDLERSEAMYNRALSTFRDLVDERGEGSAYVGLGNLAARRGEVTQAIAMWTGSVGALQEVGHYRAGTADRPGYEANLDEWASQRSLSRYQGYPGNRETSG